MPASRRRNGERNKGTTTEPPHERSSAGLKIAIQRRHVAFMNRTILLAIIGSLVALPAALLAIIVSLVVAPAAAQPQKPAAERAAPACAGQGEIPKTWEGVAFAVDGDTIAGIGLRSPIGLWGIRAPELRDRDGQEIIAGMRARAALEDMLIAGEHRVSCRIHKQDRDCRLLAQCTITAEWPTGSKAQAHDLALRLAEDGLAYGFDLADVPVWDKDAGAKMAHFEALARQARKGLWPVWLGDR